MSYNYLDKTGLASVWAKIKSALSLKANTADLATVATSGSYSDLGDTPTKVSDFENDAAYMSGMTILAYGKNNWTDFITAYTEKKVVYCRASSNSNPASGSQTRLAFMAYVNNADNPTEVEFQYYRSVSSHSNNQQGDQVYVYKLTKSSGWSVTVRESYTKVVAGTGLLGNWASGAITLSLSSAIPTKTSDLTNDSGFLTAHQNITGKEDVSNKVTTLSSSSTDTQYPSAKAVYDAIDAIPSGISNDVKIALLQIASKVTYIDEHGQDYYDDLYEALHAVSSIILNPNTLSFSAINDNQQLIATTVPVGGTVTWSSSNISVAVVDSTGVVTSKGYGTAIITASFGDVSATCSVEVAQATLVSITAVYTQSGAVYDTDTLESLKDDLVVTATWSDSSTSIISSTEYTLSGTLSEGTSVITVTYSNKTTTFNVNVSGSPSYHYSYADGDLFIINGGYTNVVNSSTTVKFAYDKRSNKINVRRAFYCANNGTLPFYEWAGDTAGESQHVTDPTEPYKYPIPVLPSATSVTVSITPKTQYIQVDTVNYNGTTYERSGTSSWSQGTQTKSVSNIGFITVMSKYDNAGSTYPTEPTNLVVTFTT